MENKSGIKIKLGLIVFYVFFLLAACEKLVESQEDTIPPTVTITHPAPSSVLSEPTIIRVEATDNEKVEKVYFLVDGANIGEDNSDPFEQYWNVSYWADDNPHTILVTGVDEAGNEGQSNLILVTVSTDAKTAPIVVSPTSGFESTESANVTLIWQSVRETEQYSVEVSTLSDFSDIVFSISVTDTTVSTPNLDEGYFYWRVRGKNNVGLLTDWSEISNFSGGDGDCTALALASADAILAYSEAAMADPMADHSALCDAMVAAYQAGLDAGCEGFDQAGLDTMQETCGTFVNLFPSFVRFAETSQSVSVGGSVSLTLNMQDFIDSVFAATMQITYDSSVVAFDDSTGFLLGEFFGSEMIVFVQSENSVIHLAISLFQGVQPVTGSGTVGSLIFTGISPGSSTIQIPASSLHLYDSNGNEVNIEDLATESATITVSP